MARKPEIIEIKKPPREAFDKNRPAGRLLLDQTLHLRHGLAKHLEKVSRHLGRVAAVLAIDVTAIKTEGEVSEYAKRVMAILHPHGGKRPRK
jgi:hypothetical protein